ncbi:MAG: winged helix-turn-helix transcriptional regulator [Clostridia bacterium]|nr:winged helix-turn-helix transcriptional regulator [Clostridia bacterium]
MEERFTAFTVLIASISRNIRRIKTEEMSHFDLKSPHVTCLYHLYKKEMTAKELCDVCDEDKAAVSRSIEFLELNGHLVCASTAKKRYKAMFSLTEKGREIGKYVTERIDAVLENASAGLGGEERENLYKSLTLISNNLQKIGETYGGK